MEPTYIQKLREPWQAFQLLTAQAILYNIKDTKNISQCVQKKKKNIDFNKLKYFQKEEKVVF